MNDHEKWAEPDWEIFEPVGFSGTFLRECPAVMAILLGGLVLAILVAIRYMAL